MASDDNMEMVPAQRVLVGTDIAMIEKGDYLLVVNGVCVGVRSGKQLPKTLLLSATSVTPIAATMGKRQRVASPVPGQPRIKQSATKHNTPAKQKKIKADKVLGLIRETPGIDSRSISDTLGIMRDDVKTRGLVTRILGKLHEAKQISYTGHRSARLYRVRETEKAAMTG